VRLVLLLNRLVLPVIFAPHLLLKRRAFRVRIVRTVQLFSRLVLLVSTVPTPARRLHAPTERTAPQVLPRNRPALLAAIALIRPRWLRVVRDRIVPRTPLLRRLVRLDMNAPPLRFQYSVRQALTALRALLSKPRVLLALTVLHLLHNLRARLVRIVLVFRRLRRHVWLATIAPQLTLKRHVRWAHIAPPVLSLRYRVLRAFTVPTQVLRLHARMARIVLRTRQLNQPVLLAAIALTRLR
jgi:hypothetical protein